MNSIRLYIDLLSEAAYDNMVASMKLKFPDSAKDIDQFVKWCKAALVKSDRITWMLRIYSAELSGNQQLLKSLLGNFDGTTQSVATQINHYFGFNVPAITNYQFLKQPVSQVLDDFEQLKDEHEFKVNREKPVTPEKKDKVLFEFSNGTKWWFVDRGYCPEEGRSGNHCGNVMGKQERSQRILSYRSPEGHVILTFILLKNGTLGEMKAKGNQKPAEKYHPYIVPLLLWDRVTGIAPTDRQYAPDLNFNVFDLNDQYLKEIDQKKPQLINSQIESTPIFMLKSPDWLKTKYRNVLEKNAPEIAPLLASTNPEDWETAIKKNSSLIIHAPNTLKNFKDRVAHEFAKNNALILQAPTYLRNDAELLRTTIRLDPQSIRAIPNTNRNYSEFCKLAVQQDAEVIGLVPEVYRTPELCNIAVQKDGGAIRFVPEEIKTFELCKTAVQTDGKALFFIPEKFKTLEVCKLAVQKDGGAIRFVPEKFRTPELCKLAVQQDGFVIYYVPEELKTLELCKLAVQQNGRVIEFIPDDLKTPEICKIAVQQDGSSLRLVPEELKTLELCKIAVRQDGGAFLSVPEKFRTPKLFDVAMQTNRTIFSALPPASRTPEICKIAVRHEGRSLYYVPDDLKTPEICKIAVQQESAAFTLVPDDVKTPEICEIAVQQNGLLIRKVPRNLITVKLCILAVNQTEEALKYIPGNIKSQIFDYEDRFSEELKRIKQLIR